MRTASGFALHQQAGGMAGSTGTSAPPHPITHPAPPCAEKYQWITKREIGPALGFVDELERRGIPYWVRLGLEEWDG